MNTNIQLNSRFRSPANKQTGAALIIGLVLLIALTIIGVSSLTTTSLEHKMAGNMGDLNLAFNAAETAGRAMQLIITPMNTTPGVSADCQATASNDATLCVLNKQDNDWWSSKDHAWWVANTVKLKRSGELDYVKTQPHAQIENLQYVSDSLVTGIDYVSKGTQYYRITSRGTGQSDKSQAIVQQTLVKRFN